MKTQLQELNQHLQDLLSTLESIAAEDEKSDELVLNLLDSIEARQSLLVNLTDADGATERDFLQEQLQMTEEFLERTKSLQAHRQQLLSISSQSKRQLNVYKTIDANR